MPKVRSTAHKALCRSLLKSIASLVTLKNDLEAAGYIGLGERVLGLINTLQLRYEKLCWS